MYVHFLASSSPKLPCFPYYLSRMEQCSPLGWLHYAEQEGKAELRRLLAHTTAELEATILAARDEISRKEEEIASMRDILVAVAKERDEARHQFQRLLIEKLCLQQQLQQMPKATAAAAAAAYTATNAASFSSSDSEESVISEPLNHQLATPSSPTLSSSLPPQLAAVLGPRRPLPEKGRLLQAVMEAGPTLETLLLAGQLPQWQQPPPQLDRIEIPPVTMPTSPVVQPRLLAHQDSIASNNGCMVNPNTTNNNKRGLDRFDGPGLSPSRCSKYQRVVQTS